MVEHLIVFVFGLIIGSFCNVVIYRLPQESRSLPRDLTADRALPLFVLGIISLY